MKRDYEKLYSKALKVGTEMLEHAAKLDKAVLESKDINAVALQRTLAFVLRDYYKRMFE